MPKSSSDQRRLIKFSNYSMCVTIPKWVVDQLQWQKGDLLTLDTDIKQGKIILYKASAIELNRNSSKNNLSPALDSSQSDLKIVSEILPEKPTPKLRW